MVGLWAMAAATVLAAPQAAPAAGAPPPAVVADDPEVAAMYAAVPNFAARWPTEALVRSLEPALGQLAASMRRGGVSLEPAALMPRIRWQWGLAGPARATALGARRAAWTPDASPRVGRDEALTAWRNYLLEFAEVAQARLVTVEAIRHSAQRAEARVALAVAGRDRDGARRADGGRVRVELALVRGTWRLAAVTLERLETTLRPRPLFEDVSDAWLGELDDATFARLRLETPDPAPGRAGPAPALAVGPHAGVAAADVDGDGYDDLLVWDEAGRATLLANRRGRGFAAVTAAAGLAPPEVSAALFADLDNDGVVDLVLGRWAAPSQLFYGSQSAAGSPLFLQAAATLPDRVVGVVAADVDHDGRLDLYFARAGAADEAPPGDVLMHGDGARTLHDGTAAAGLSAAGASGSTAQASLFDLDDDGWPDLVRAAVGQPTAVWHNAGGRFVATATAPLPADAHALAWADLDGDGRAELIVSGADLPAAGRIARAAAAAGDASIAAAAAGRGTAIFSPPSWRRWPEAALPAAWGAADFSWGAAVLDLDNDGWPDLVAANGLHSGPRGPVRGVPRQLDADRLRQACGAPACGGALPAGAAAMGLAGDQWDVALASGRGRILVDVAYVAGLAGPRDGRAAVAVDLDRDGAADLVRVGGEAPGLALLRNTTGPTQHTLTLRLVGDGVRSNADAVGARLRVTCAGRAQTLWRLAAAGAAGQPGAALQVGLGDCAGPVDLEIAWPSGRRQRVAGIAADAAYLWAEGAPPIL